MDIVIMRLIKFALSCINAFAWPIFALALPLCASIRAVETGSIYHMKKLVIYWTIFSMISLFELAFVKIIQWIPYWATIKLITTLWLVIPRLNGACFVYEKLIHPLLSLDLNLQPFIDTVFHKPKEKKTLAIETLGKPWKEPDAARTDGENSAAIERSAKEVKEMMPSEPIGENGPPETAPLKKSSQEWTCALCNVTVTSEITLNAHLKGSKHKSKLQALKTSIHQIGGSQQNYCVQPTQQAKLKQDCATTQPSKLLCRVCSVKMRSETDLANHMKGKRHSSNIEKMTYGVMNGTSYNM